jgi:hypothetical protein
VSVSVNNGSTWQNAAEVTGNVQSLLDVTFKTRTTVTAIRIQLGDLPADAFGAVRARIFEVVPLTNPQSPLPLDTTLRYT